MENRGAGLNNLRFKGHTEPWEQKKLGELEDEGRVKLGRGRVISKNDVKRNPGNYPIYSSSALNNGLFAKYGEYDFDDERLTWSVDGGGKFFYRAPHKYSITNVCGWLKVNDLETISTRYLHEALTRQWMGKNFDYLHKAHPSVIRNEYTIPLPSLAEQERIGGFLSALDERLKVQSELVDLLALEYTGYSQRIFNQTLRFKDENGNNYPDWEQKKLVSVVDLVGGGTPSTDEPSYWGGDIQWFTPAEINSRFASKSMRTISDAGLSKSSAKLLPAGTVILTTRATLGDMAILQNEATTNQGFQNLIPKEGATTSDYLFALQPLIKNYCIKKSSGTTFKEISKKELSKMDIPLPSLHEQVKIGGFLSALSARIEAERALLAQYKEQKKAYLQKLLP